MQSRAHKPHRYIKTARPSLPVRTRRRPRRRRLAARPTTWIRACGSTCGTHLSQSCPTSAVAARPRAPSQVYCSRHFFFLLSVAGFSWLLCGNESERGEAEQPRQTTRWECVEGKPYETELVSWTCSGRATPRSTCNEKRGVGSPHKRSHLKRHSPEARSAHHVCFYMKCSRKLN